VRAADEAGSSLGTGVLRVGQVGEQHRATFGHVRVIRQDVRRRRLHQASLHRLTRRRSIDTNVDQSGGGGGGGLRLVGVPGQDGAQGGEQQACGSD